MQCERNHFTHLRVACNFILRDVIGDAEFVYHIWQDSDPTRIGIGRGQPSLTKRLPPQSFPNIARADGSCSHKQTLPEVTRGKIQPLSVTSNALKWW